jgi:hypothetical protein
MSMLKVVQEQSQPNEHAPAAVGGSLLDELVRDGARQMLAAALLAEVAAYVDAHAHLVDEEGHRVVVRNGHHQPREVATAAGAVPVRQPRVNDRRIDEVTGSGDVSPRRSCLTSALIRELWIPDLPREGASFHATRPRAIHRF